MSGETGVGASAEISDAEKARLLEIGAHAISCSLGYFMSEIRPGYPLGGEIARG